MASRANIIAADGRTDRLLLPIFGPSPYPDYWFVACFDHGGLGDGLQSAAVGQGRLAAAVDVNFLSFPVLRPGASRRMDGVLDS